MFGEIVKATVVPPILTLWVGAEDNFQVISIDLSDPTVGSEQYSRLITFMKNNSISGYYGVPKGPRLVDGQIDPSSLLRFWVRTEQDIVTMKPRLASP